MIDLLQLAVVCIVVGVVGISIGLVIMNGLEIPEPRQQQTETRFSEIVLVRKLSGKSGVCIFPSDTSHKFDTSNMTAIERDDLDGVIHISPIGVVEIYRSEHLSTSDDNVDT